MADTIQPADRISSFRRFVKPGLVTTAMLAVFIAGQNTWRTAAAQDGKKLAERFRQLDRNNDGELSADEFADKSLFERLDTNRNGKIPFEEARLAVRAGALNDVAKKPAAMPEPEPSTTVAMAPIRQGPKRLQPGEHGVGGFVADAEFRDLNGKTLHLSDFAKRKAIVVAMTSTSCPLSLRYLPTLTELAKKYEPLGVQFLLVNPVSVDDEPEMKTTQQTLGTSAMYVFDKEQTLATAVGALSTTDVLVMDASRTIVYHGAVDDQYGFGYANDAPRHHYLQDAIEATLNGQTPLVAATDAPGCALGLEEQESRSTDITYHRQISRLIQRHCVECHRTDGVAPFPMETYEQVAAHAPMIRTVIDRNIMPPWFAAPDSHTTAEPGMSSRWLNDRSLSTSEKTTLLNWIAQGRAEGDLKDAPQPRTFADGWHVGTPDVVFGFATPVRVKATGTMPYQNVTVETDLTEDKWVQAIEVRPGNRSVVHHVIVSLHKKRADEGAESSDDTGDDERQGFWGIYVPGNSTLSYPEGFAKRLPAGVTMRFQMHYTPNGTATEDQTQIGLVFAKSPPKHEVRVAGIVNSRLNIPPGDSNHREVASLKLPADVQVLAFLPHMHLRGKAARYEVISSGESRMLLDIPRYDFNWQLLYRLAEPLTLSRGDTIRFTGWFDNSEGNPANPDPTKTVHWGPQTFDEMLLGYVEYFVPTANTGTVQR